MRNSFAVPYLMGMFCATLCCSLPGQEAIFDFGTGKFALDSTRSRLYVTVPDQNSLAVLDTETFELVSPLFFVGFDPVGLDLSEDGSRLYIANRGATAGAISVVDLETLTLIDSFDLERTPVDVAVGPNNTIYASVNRTSPSGKLDYLNGLTGEFLGTFDYSVIPTVGPGLLETSHDRNVLYHQVVGYSGSNTYRYDISSGGAGLPLQEIG